MMKAEERKAIVGRMMGRLRGPDPLTRTEQDFLELICDQQAQIDKLSGLVFGAMAREKKKLGPLASERERHHQ